MKAPSKRFYYRPEKDAVASEQRYVIHEETTATKIGRIVLKLETIFLPIVYSSGL